MAILKRRLNYNTPSGETNTLHLETSSDMVQRADGSTIEEAIANINASIAQLQTQVNTEMDAKINEAITGIIDGAPDAFDTLKEFYDWTQTHETAATGMVTDIADLKTRVTALESSNGQYQLVEVTEEG